MTYAEVITLADNLGIMQSYTFIKMGRGKALDMKFLKIKLVSDGRIPELSIFWQEIEKRVGTKRTFSHNAMLATATITLYQE